MTLQLYLWQVLSCFCFSTVQLNESKLIANCWVSFSGKRGHAENSWQRQHRKTHSGCWEGSHPSGDNSIFYVFFLVIGRNEVIMTLPSRKVKSILFINKNKTKAISQNFTCKLGLFHTTSSTHQHSELLKDQVIGSHEVKRANLQRFTIYTVTTIICYSNWTDELISLG